MFDERRISTDATLSAKINQMLTLSRNGPKFINKSNRLESEAIKSLDALLVECQEFVEELLSRQDNRTEEVIIKPQLKVNCKCTSRCLHDFDDKKSPKLFLGAIQSLHFPVFGKNISQENPKRRSRFSFESFKTHFSKLVTSYRLPTPPLEDNIHDKDSDQALKSLKHTNSVFF